jgi:hypothetical protein
MHEKNNTYVYANDVNLLGANINTTKKNIEIIIDGH